MFNDILRIDPRFVEASHRGAISPDKLLSSIRIRHFVKCHILVVASLLFFVHQTATPFVRAEPNDAARVGLDESDRRVDVALRLFEKSDSVAGEAELKQVAQEYPACARAHFYLGVLSQKRGESERAVGFYATALHADENHADATNNIGAVLTVLSPDVRVQTAKTFGLLPTLIQDDGGNSVVREEDVAFVDEMVERFFRKTLEIDGSHRWALNNLGLHMHSHGRDCEALPIFVRALELHPRDPEIHFNLGVSLQRLGMVQEAARHFAAALDSNPKHAGAALNLAALHHRYGETSDAVDLYRRVAMVLDPGDTDMTIMLRNNLGTALFLMGEHTLSMVEHQAVLSSLEARENGPPPPIAKDNHGDKYDVYVDTLVNLHRARKASCDWRDWEIHIFELKHQVDARQLGLGHPPALLPFDSLLLSYPVDPAWRRRIAEAHSTRYAPVVPSYTTTPTTPGQNVESLFGRKRIVHEEETDARISEGGSGGAGSLRVFSGSEDDRGDGGGGTMEEVAARPVASSGRALTLGFIGHDFDEHPTAHMMAGVFLWQKRFEDNGRVLRSSDGEEVAPVEETVGTEASGEHVGTATNVTKRATSRSCCRYLAYSYGGGRGERNPDDGTVISSRVRESIRSCVASFVDLYASGHEKSAARIRADGVDILVDLQGHTLGGRSEIIAARPARLQVSYLVFPGTSGAPYMDYLISDRHVTPPEHARHYSESFVLLPRTYQANLYEGIMPPASTMTSGDGNIAELRKAYGLPADLSRAVFANFNKVDKLEPESFSLWMQILRRVPGSMLWLLDARAVEAEKQAIRQRLRREAESQGVDGRRIVWAQRVPKREHLLRHAAADLFLDTLTYGAHSTASDALAGGLPFLTLAGESFASRVGVSLLRNVDPAQRTLIVYSQREYEDLAVALLSTPHGRKLLDRLRTSLKSGGELYCWKSLREEAGDERGDHSVREEERRMPRVRVGLPLFDTEKITEDLNRAFMLMSDVYDVWRDRRREGRIQEGASLPHIILTDEKSRG